MPRFIVTRRRHLFERVEVDAPTAAEAKRRAEDLARGGLVPSWKGAPEHWSAQKVTGS